MDEGLLHAYLDGAFPPGNPQGEEIEAHLGVCVDCRVRLEDARLVKDRAALVLRHAAPARVDVPPFDTILQRRPAADAPARGRASGRPYWLPSLPLAWAATLILALGAGWMGRELMYRSTGPSSVADASLDRAAGPAAEPQPAAREAEVDQAAAPQRAIEQAQSSTLADRALSNDARNAAGSAADSRREAAAGTGQGQARRETPPPAATPAAPPPAEALARKAVPDSTARALALEERVVTLDPLTRRARVADAAFTPVRDVAEVLRGEVAEALIQVARESSLLDLLNGELTASSTAGWTEIPAAQMPADLASQAPVLTGATRVQMQLAQVENRTLVRTSYQLENDAQVQVIRYRQPQAFAADERQERERMDAANLLASGVPLSGLSERSPLFAGQTVLWVRRNGADLLLRGALSEDSLRAVASRIR